MLTTLKKILKKHKALYLSLKTLKSLAEHDSDLERTLDAFYNANSPLVVGDSFGLRSKKRIIYKICFGVSEKEAELGFFALVRQTMYALCFAEILGFSPVIIWGKHCIYYDINITSITNAFEYFFLPIDLDSRNEESEVTGVVLSKKQDRQYISKLILNGREGYSLTVDDVGLYARLFSTYFKINEETCSYIYDGISMLGINRGKTLGVHIRGTDYKKNYNEHPEFIGFSAYLDAAKKEFHTQGYSQLFLATDDYEALGLFIEEFGGSLLYYSDFERSSDSVGIHSKNKDNPSINGFNVLRDVFSLANCAGLICGKSQVSFAARYINKALGLSYSSCTEIETHINHNANSLKKRKNN